MWRRRSSRRYPPAEDSFLRKRTSGKSKRQTAFCVRRPRFLQPTASAAASAVAVVHRSAFHSFDNAAAIGVNFARAHQILKQSDHPRRRAALEVLSSLPVYLRPGTIEEAVSHLRAGRYVVVAGCTDYYARPLADAVLDITGISEARGIVDTDGHFRLGALTTWAEIAAAELPPQFDALKEAARQVGGVQIQNAGTLGGNLCNASPAADGVPPLLALDARVELRSASGVRILPLAEFIVGNRRTVRRPDEMLTAILVPKRRGRHASRFLKLGARTYQVISIVMVAALLEVDERGRICAAAVVVGACSEVAQRLFDLESVLVGAAIGGAPLSGAVRDEHLASLWPVSDVRGTAAYRLDAARTLIRRALDEVQERCR
jgi:CO/xanthine dehydrogenase FAD-binding subunit